MKIGKKITIMQLQKFKLQLQQNLVINYNFFNYKYNFSNPDYRHMQ